MSHIYHLHRQSPRGSNRLFWTWLSAALIAASSCSTARPPSDLLANAELALRSANEARADELAPVDFKNAREKLAQAQQAMAADKYNEARRFAESAQVDAELAEAKAETEVMRRAADQVLRKGYAPPTKAELQSRESRPQASPKE